MRILYVAMKYDYGKPEQGYSFEHYNFFDSLLHMGHDITYFDFMSLMQRDGRRQMNERLLETVKTEKPDVMFTVLFSYELDKKVISRISEKTDTKTVNWFCDDHWRFDNYSRHWTPCFDWVVTTAASALPKYARMGYKNVIKSQWGCNHTIYRKLNLPLEYDATFIGLPHGDRRETVRTIHEAGINVQCWGKGWESGRLTQDEMIRVFNQSRINLNLSNASVYTEPKRWKNLARTAISDLLEIVPFGSHIKTVGKARLSGLSSSKSNTKVSAKDSTVYEKCPDQIKGRNFEVPGCGGFLLTSMVENLGDYYEIGKEVVCFENVDDAIEKIRYYLEHEEERASIAQAGYLRTLHEHTYAARFNAIFRKIGLPCEDSEIREGRVREI